MLHAFIKPSDYLHWATRGHAVLTWGHVMPTWELSIPHVAKCIRIHITLCHPTSILKKKNTVLVLLPIRVFSLRLPSNTGFVPPRYALVQRPIRFFSLLPQFSPPPRLLDFSRLRF